jgi:ketosteroid isomerase-like protein
MKIIISFLAPLFLAAMTFAQEESPAPTESTAPTSEEKASATVEETPPTIEPSTQKSEEPASTPAPASTTTKKSATTSTAKTSASNTTKPATAAPAASTSKTMNKNMSVRDMENVWEAAVGKHDHAAVEGFVAADFAGVSSKDKFVDRDGMLSEFKSDKDTYKSTKNERLNVKMYGSNVAVVTGRARETGTGKDGKAFDRTFLFTDTWMMRGGKWQCIASQTSKIKG